MADTPKWKESDTNLPGSSRSGSGMGRPGDYNQEISAIRDELSKLSEAVGGTMKSAVAPMTRQLEAAVVRNPTTSLLIAAGIGLLFGLMRSR